MVDVLRHADALWAAFPSLVPGVLHADGIRADVVVEEQVATYTAVARNRLAGAAIADLPEIGAWRRAFAAMGLKPTQYRCASEALLRRLHKEGSLPRIHPLVDLCNAVSVAFAIPVAVLDLAEVRGPIEVRHATGAESYLAFDGTTEHPQPGEVVFADAAGQAHARRWTNRQSARSAVRAATSSVLIVAEALHDTAPRDVERLTAALATELAAVWSIDARPVLLSRAAPEFAVGAPR